MDGTKQFGQTGKLSETSDGSGTSWLAECNEICSQIRKRIKQGCSRFDPEKVSTSSGSRRTTVGLMVDGLTIDNIVIGGPAHNSGELNRGDRIVAVDFQSVTEDTLPDLLIGEDVPLSTVTLTVLKSGSTSVTRDVVLNRMAIESIADRCRMFELFASLKVLNHRIKFLVL